MDSHASGSGEIGRHTILRGWRPKGMGVQVPPSAPDRILKIASPEPEFMRFERSLF
jgi:hypothetical protein